MRVAVLFLLICTNYLTARDSLYFQSPVKHEIILAGSFGELRSTHFHAGIDIKPANKVVGDSLMASAKGFVSRIKIQTGGYGQALYIDHPNGFTTVYAHLLAFPDSIQLYISKMQEAAQSYSIDLYPDSARFEFEKGEFIGLMGNTGRSYAPHLHFEIRHTQSEIPEDPGLWGISASDHKAPILQSYSIEGLTPDFRRTWQKIYYPTAQIHQGDHIIPAWRVGVNVQAFDQMDGSSNRNGVYHRQLFVDGVLHWESKTDRVDWGETKYINAYIDYNDKKELNRTAVCGYILPGNPLNIYTDSLNNQPINLFKDKAREIEIVLKDMAGNERKISFSLRRSEEIPNPEFEGYNLKIKWDSAYQFKAGHSRFKIHERTFAKDTYFSYEEEIDSIENHFKIHDHKTRIFRPIDTKIRIPHFDSVNHDKYCLVYQDEKRKTTFGGEVDDKSLVGRINRLGGFTIVLDTIPPTIQAITFNRSVKNFDAFTFRVDDNLASMGEADEVDIDVFIDGQWQITPYKIMTRILSIPLVGIDTGVHELKIRVRDDRGNVTVWSDTFER